MVSTAKITRISWRVTKGRLFDPEQTQFLSPDPVYQTSAGQGLNRYTYVYNQPTRLVDPSGYEGEVWDMGFEQDVTVFGTTTFQPYDFSSGITVSSWFETALSRHGMSWSDVSGSRGLDTTPPYLSFLTHRGGRGTFPSPDPEAEITEREMMNITALNLWYGIGPAAAEFVFDFWDTFTLGLPPGNEDERRHDVYSLIERWNDAEARLFEAPVGPNGEQFAMAGVGSIAQLLRAARVARAASFDAALERHLATALRDFQQFGYTARQREVLRFEPYLERVSAGERVDAYFRQSLALDRGLAEAGLRMTPRGKFGPDVFHRVSRHFWDVTTAGSWRRHADLYRELYGTGRPTLLYELKWLR